LAAGKHVVTANKAMIAMFGKEICGQARFSGVSISFEASCGGGIPLISSIQRGLIANETRGIYGILNGTCNYILSEMHGANDKSYAVGLREAQDQGFAEPDPTLDVSGVDTAHKITILASLAFGVSADFNQVSVEGIESVDVMDIRAGQELGYVCKLLAIAEKQGEQVSLRVHPAFIRKDHPLAGVSGPFNAVSVYGSQVGHTMFYGRGAGPSPTASAILADVIDTALGNAGRAFDQLPIFPDVTPPAQYKPIDDVTVRYYFRINVVDRPGVMAEITRIFGDQGISLSAVNQHEAPEDARENVVPIAVLTHLAKEGDAMTAMAKIEGMDAVCAKPVCIRLMEEPEEF
jgi:homoserine dehydrogenase